MFILSSLFCTSPILFWGGRRAASRPPHSCSLPTSTPTLPRPCQEEREGGREEQRSGSIAGEGISNGGAGERRRRHQRKKKGASGGCSTRRGSDGRGEEREGWSQPRQLEEDGGRKGGRKDGGREEGRREGGRKEEGREGGRRPDCSVQC